MEAPNESAILGPSDNVNVGVNIINDLQDVHAWGLEKKTAKARVLQTNDAFLAHCAKAKFKLRTTNEFVEGSIDKTAEYVQRLFRAYGRSIEYFRISVKRFRKAVITAQRAAKALVTRHHKLISDLLEHWKINEEKQRRIYRKRIFTEVNRVNGRLDDKPKRAQITSLLESYIDVFIPEDIKKLAVKELINEACLTWRQDWRQWKDRLLEMEAAIRVQAEIVNEQSEQLAPHQFASNCGQDSAWIKSLAVELAESTEKLTQLKAKRFLFFEVEPILSLSLDDYPISVLIQKARAVENELAAAERSTTIFRVCCHMETLGTECGFEVVDKLLHERLTSGSTSTSTMATARRTLSTDRGLRPSAAAIVPLLTIPPSPKHSDLEGPADGPQLMRFHHDMREGEEDGDEFGDDGYPLATFSCSTSSNQRNLLNEELSPKSARRKISVSLAEPSSANVSGPPPCTTPRGSAPCTTPRGSSLLTDRHGVRRNLSSLKRTSDDAAIPTVSPRSSNGPSGNFSLSLSSSCNLSSSAPFPAPVSPRKSSQMLNSMNLSAPATSPLPLAGVSPRKTIAPLNLSVTEMAKEMPRVSPRLSSLLTPSSGNNPSARSPRSPRNDIDRANKLWMSSPAGGFPPSTSHHRSDSAADLILKSDALVEKAATPTLLTSSRAQTQRTATTTSLSARKLSNDGGRLNALSSARTTRSQSPGLLSRTSAAPNASGGGGGGGGGALRGSGATSVIGGVSGGLGGSINIPPLRSLTPDPSQPERRVDILRSRRNRAATAGPISSSSPPKARLLRGASSSVAEEPASVEDRVLSIPSIGSSNVASNSSGSGSSSGGTRGKLEKKNSSLEDIITLQDLASTPKIALPK